MHHPQRKALAESLVRSASSAAEAMASIAVAIMEEDNPRTIFLAKGLANLFQDMVVMLGRIEKVAAAAQEEIEASKKKVN